MSVRNQQELSMAWFGQTYLWVLSIHLPHVFSGRNLGDSFVMEPGCFAIFVHVQI